MQDKPEQWQHDASNLEHLSIRWYGAGVQELVTFARITDMLELVLHVMIVLVMMDRLPVVLTKGELANLA